NLSAKGREEFTIAEFMVGHDVGLGSLPQISSTLSAGLRYAAFDSESSADLHGSPDGYVPPVLGLLIVIGMAEPSSRTIHHAEFRADRSFEGVGPVVTWDVSHRLLGDEDSGGLNADLSLTAGALFGKQTANVEYDEVSRLYEWGEGDFLFGSKPGFTPAAESSVASPPIARSDDVTVPLAGVSLGLSYNIDRIKIGAGYRFERYFDAIDGGIEEAEQHDRDIHGPFLKLSVGFGG
ncbi:MAG TPA: Lpg1974 family pore-forming outer membrane protein, partial [Caulobacteraceae bacterium]|nr:Lpg1974 family pore-forming outer membrane protein [Caulobacteraceae bacterium]